MNADDVSRFEAITGPPFFEKHYEERNWENMKNKPAKKPNRKLLEIWANLYSDGSFVQVSGIVDLTHRATKIIGTNRIDYIRTVKLREVR